MQRTRPLATRLSGMGFVCIVSTLIFFVYGVFVFIIWFPELNTVQLLPPGSNSDELQNESQNQMSTNRILVASVAKQMDSDEFDNKSDSLTDTNPARRDITDLSDDIYSESESDMVIDQNSKLKQKTTKNQVDNGIRSNHKSESVTSDAKPDTVSVTSPEPNNSFFPFGLIPSLSVFDIQSTISNSLTQSNYESFYFHYVYHVGIVVQCLFHMVFILHLIAFINAVLIDPGVVPQNWGFYMGDETKRRRYCKMCNVWKPDRTHHCSLCQRCILNMDHHCPWINNCVGFYNRKFFMQFVVYVWICLLTVIIYSLPLILDKFWMIWAYWFGKENTCGFYYGSDAFDGRNPYELYEIRDVMRLLIMFFGYSMALLLGCTLTNFMKFHIKLISENYTTIENLERDENARSRYDIGMTRNWEQVFGAQTKYWWIPSHKYSRPVGDGVRWRVHYTRVIDEDEEMCGEEDHRGNNKLLR